MYIPNFNDFLNQSGMFIIYILSLVYQSYELYLIQFMRFNIYIECQDKFSEPYVYIWRPGDTKILNFPDIDQTSGAVILYCDVSQEMQETVFSLILCSWPCW